MDKCLEHIKVWLPESLKRDLQDLAAERDRTLSDFIRALLEDAVYGLQRTLCRYVGPGARRGDEGR